MQIDGRDYADLDKVWLKTSVKKEAHLDVDNNENVVEWCNNKDSLDCEGLLITKNTIVQ